MTVSTKNIIANILGVSLKNRITAAIITDLAVFSILQGGFAEMSKIGEN